MKPQEPIPHNYSIRRLNMIFALSSLVLLAVTGLMVGYDYIRGWKWVQLEFMRMQQERSSQEITVAQAEENQQQAELERRTKHLADLQLALQESTRKRDAAKANVDQWLKKIKDAEDKKKELTAS